MDPLNGSKLKGTYFPDEVLELILCHVEIQTLLNCRRVCKKWNTLIVGQVLKIRASWAGLTQGMSADEKLAIPWNSWYILLSPNSPFGCNLIKNPCGQDKLSSWVIVDNGGDGWRVEAAPEGLAADVPPSPPEAPLRNFWSKKTRSKRGAAPNPCFVTSFGPCVKQQTVPLTYGPLMTQIFDRHRPAIVYREWFCRRHDCGGNYTLTVTLLDKDRQELLKQIHHTTVDDFNWRKVENKLVDYPEGTRYVKFCHRASDNQFWKGHYGPKITHSTVMLVPPGVAYEIDVANNVPAMTDEEFQEYLNQHQQPMEPAFYIDLDQVFRRDPNLIVNHPDPAQRLYIPRNEQYGRGEANQERRSDQRSPLDLSISSSHDLNRNDPAGTQERRNDLEERQERRYDFEEIMEISDGEMSYDELRILSRRRRLNLEDFYVGDQEMGNESQVEREERGRSNDNLSSPPFHAVGEDEERGEEGEDRPP